jgi:hypothetical protein
MYETRYMIVYRNDDGSYSGGEFLHHNQWCAVDNIPLGEGRDIVCIGRVQVYDLKHNDPVMTPAELREMWAAEIATEKAKWNAQRAE